MHFFKSRASSFKLCSDRIVIYGEIGLKEAAQMPAHRL